MLWLVIILLSCALLVALIRLFLHHRAIRTLNVALLQRQPFLQEERAIIPAWRDLCATANILVEDFNRLDKQRAGQLAQLEATLGSLQEAVLVVDAANTILLANKALSAIFPHNEAILHQRLEGIVRNASFLRYVDAVRREGARPQEEIEFEGNGTAAWLEVTGTVIPALHNSQAPCALFVLHNITRQKRLEAVRKEFVANVSHELRTPLSVIKGYAETLIDGGPDMPSAQRERFLQIIRRHTDRLASLLEDLLTLSRLESSNTGLHREPGDLERLIKTLLEDYRTRPSAGRHALNLTLDASQGPLNFDALKLTQVFQNLIDNALKYTPPGSRIDISIHPRSSETEVCVSDNGPGIPAEDLPHIFERFYRVDKGRSRETGGTGLGLAIVKHIIQLHGGRVWVQSKPGHGTSFHFTIPASVRRAEVAKQ